MWIKQNLKKLAYPPYIFNQKFGKKSSGNPDLLLLFFCGTILFIIMPV
jgi:hypothetical protein